RTGYRGLDGAARVRVRGADARQHEPVALSGPRRFRASAIYACGEEPAARAGAGLGARHIPIRTKPPVTLPDTSAVKHSRLRDRSRARIISSQLPPLSM